MAAIQDGPYSSLFVPLALHSNVSLASLADAGISAAMAAALEVAPSGECVGWGIPFLIDQVLVVDKQPVTVELTPTTAQWLVFLHTSDLRPTPPGAHGFISPMRGEGQLAELAATYVMVYADGAEVRAPIRRRHQLGMFQRRWGENCFEAVPQSKPRPTLPAHEQPGAPGVGARRA